MKRPQNFENIHYEKFKCLGINWEIQLGRRESELTSKVYLIHLEDKNLNRIFCLDVK